MFQYDAANTGHAPDLEGPDRKVANRWTFETGAEVQASPVVVDGVVYVGSEDGYFYAIHADSGEQKWRYPAEDPIASAAAYANGFVYFIDEDGYVHKVDAEDGDRDQRIQVEGDINSNSPLAVSDGTVYVISEEDDEDGGILTALRADDLGRKWETDTGYAEQGPAVADEETARGGLVYAVFGYQPGLRAFEDDGDEEWTNDESAVRLVTPSVGQERIFFGDGNGDFFAITRSGDHAGIKEWITEVPGEDVEVSAAVGDDRVYVGGLDRLQGLDIHDGDVEWDVDVGDTDSAPVLVDNTLYIVSGQGVVHALDPGDGDTEWTYEMEVYTESAPAVVGKHIFVGAEDGTVRALKPQDPAYFDVSGLQAPSQVVTGDSMEVSATVQNTGDATGSQTVVYRLDGETRASRTITLDGDERTTVTFNIDTGAVSSGEYTHGIHSDDANATTSIDIDAPADLSITSVTANATTVAPNETVQVNATVKNTGDVSGTTTLALATDGTTADETELTVPGGESRKVTFATRFEALGEHSVQVNDQTPVVVTVQRLAPVADAGPDTAVKEGTQVILDATNSTDPNGDRLQYDWTQVDGPTVTLDSSGSNVTTFTAPEVPNETTLTFSVTVTDPSGRSDTDVINVTVDDAPTLRLNATTTSVGNESALALTLSEAPRGFSKYVIDVTFDPDVVELIRTTLPSSLEPARVLETTVVDPGSEALGARDPSDQIQPGATDVRLGTLVFEGRDGGQADVRIDVRSLLDETNESFVVTTDRGRVIVNDTTPPTISGFSVQEAGSRTIAVSFNSSEPVTNVTVTLRNDTETVATLTESDFTQSGDEQYHYEATYQLASYGTVVGQLEETADDSRNDGASGQSDRAMLNSPVGIRQVPDTVSVTPGSAVQFTTEIAVPEEYNGAAVDVQLPSKWNITAQSSDGGIFKPSRTRWVWIKTGVRSVEYTVDIPDNATRETYAVNVTGLSTNPDADRTERNQTTSLVTVVNESFSPPEARFDIEPGTPRVGDTVSFNASASVDPDGEITAYRWDFDGDGQVDANGTAVETAFADNETYRVTLTVVDDDGKRDNLMRSITVVEASNRQPTAEFSAQPSTPVAGDSVRINASGSVDPDGSITAYRWDFDGDGQIDANGKVVNTTFPSAASYSIVLTVIDDDGAVDSVQETLDVRANDTVSESEGAVDISVENATIVAGEAATVRVVANGSDVAGYKATLNFDPEIVRIADVTEGDLGSPITRVDNATGELVITGAQAQARSDPVLARIEVSIPEDADSQRTTLAFVEDETTVNNASESLSVATYDDGVVQITACQPGDADADGRLSPLDATKTLRQIAGLSVADPFNVECADYTDDGKVSPLDATKILREVAGLSVEPTSTVTNGSTAAASTSTDDNTGATQLANAERNGPATVQTQSETSNRSAADVYVDEFRAASGDTATARIYTSNASNVAGYQVNLTFDPDVVQVNRVGDGAFGSPLSRVNNSHGFVVLTQASAQGVENPHLANVTFNVVGDAGESSHLAFVAEETRVNNVSSSLPVRTHNGTVSVEKTDAVNEREVVPFAETQALSGGQVSPSSLGGKIRTEPRVNARTTVTLLQSTPTNYSLALNVTGHPQNVTFYVQRSAVESSQGVENLTMYLDGEEHPFTVVSDTGPGNSPWIGVVVPHFSTRTVSFVADSSGPAPLSTELSAPIDPDNDAVYEDVNGDGNVSVVDVQALFANRESSAVRESPSAYDFNGESGFDIVDVQALFDQVRSGTVQ